MGKVTPTEAKEEERILGWEERTIRSHLPSGWRRVLWGRPGELEEQMLGQYSCCLPSKKGRAGVGLERAWHHTAHIPQERLWVSLK